MPPPLPFLVRHLADPAQRISDGECLRRFAEDRDEEAFAELVRRNGPLVLRACRSVLRDASAADDAFQKTFLQLARHATNLTGVSSAAGWLHKAAVRAAGAIRRAEARRRRHEGRSRPVTEVSPPADLTWLEVREAIDAELARAPEKYRLPLLLCYIEGLPYSDAAARIGCPPAALRGRLERGRRWLRRRLEGRGLPAAALVLGPGASAAVSAGLRERTLSAVRTLQARSAGLINWHALVQSHRVFLGGCVALVAAIGIGLGAGPNSAAPSQEPPTGVAEASGAAKAPDFPRDAFGDPLPRGASARLGTRRLLNYSRDLALSPDGKTLAISDALGQSLTVLDAVTGQVLRYQASVGVGGVYKLPGTAGHISTPGIFWSSGGRGVALVGRHSWDKYLWEFTDPKDTPPTFEPQPNDILTPAPPEGGISCAAVSADGKWVAVARQPSDPTRRVIQVFPCTTGKHLRNLKADRTLGPFSVACERIWFTANGRELVLARADGTVLAIDAATGKELRRATLPKWAVIATSSDGKFVAIVPGVRGGGARDAGDETARVWDLTTGKEVWKFPRSGDSISGLAFTPDGKFLVTSDAEFEFRKRDLTSGRESVRRRTWKGIDSMSAVAVSADGARYVTARDSAPITVGDAATGAHLNPLATHRDAVAGVAVSPDSRLVATVGYDGGLRVWQTASGKPVCTVAAPRVNPQSRNYGPHRAVAFTPDGRGIVFDAAGVLTMTDPMTGKPRELPGGLQGLAGTLGGFAPDGQSLVTFSGDAATLWNWPGGTARQTVRVALGKRLLWGPPPKTQQAPVVVGAALSPDGKILFTVSNQQSVPDDEWDGPNSTDCWDVRTGTRRFQLAPSLWYPRLAFSPDSRTLYAGGHPSDSEGKHGRVRRDGLASWDVATGALVRRFDDPLGAPDPLPDARRVCALAVSPDGRLLAVSEDSYSDPPRVWVYETVTGRVVRHFDGHARFIYDLAFTPDGSKLISVSYDHTGLIWDLTLPTFTDRKSRALTPKEQADSWGRLAAPDPVLAWQAIADLANSPAETVTFLADRLKPPPVPSTADLDRIEKQLGAPNFSEREEASAELDTFGPNAVAPVQKRLKATESPEVAQRFNEFLKRHAGERSSPYVLREVRGVAVLEAIGTPEAQDVLTRFAERRPADQLGVEAAAALARLKKLSARK